jgi:hypothetical protein
MTGSTRRDAGRSAERPGETTAETAMTGSTRCDGRRTTTTTTGAARGDEP